MDEASKQMWQDVKAGASSRGCCHNGPSRPPFVGQQKDGRIERPRSFLQAANTKRKKQATNVVETELTLSVDECGVYLVEAR